MDNKANKMLIDATHPEETRVVVLRQGRVEEFDYESAARKPLRGNIYLAKVTRVEPSLQAAFVEYGGNRHGFLAFSEIHPDYYQIPVADRQALLQEEAEAEAEADAEADARAEARLSRRASNDDSSDQGAWSDGGDQAAPATGHHSGDAISEPYDTPAPHHDHAADPDGAPAGDGLPGHVEEVPLDGAAEAPETIGSDADDNGEGGDALEEVPTRPRRRMRSYKIQEVIKRRQVILIQVVKEERGNKGAALTTYLSLAGRYTVLMPNTGRGGGISRKITSAQDRKRLKAIATELEVPDGMGLIVRTAGAARTMQEIRRDYEYLLRLWENVRDLTLQSVAPSLVYEEGNLIKRSIRDLYTKEIDEIVVAGDGAYKEASDFMRMLMPSHVKNVIHHKSGDPLFARYPIERQLNAMFSPHVTLRSGGYLVINQTEALVAIDVNSGKSTREYSIEETALNTNLEAADEVARQLKLRDLAGLIVIDFIDMEEKRNNRAVERRMKDALRFDRARIQVGHISHFGLMEMSRQRLRTGVLEGSTTKCPHCEGSGTIRSTESVALAVLRGLDDHLVRDPRSSVVALTNPVVALYLLNHKRGFITEMESRFGVTIAVEASDRMQGATFSIERSSAPVQPRRPQAQAAVNMEWGFEGETPHEPAEAAHDEHFDERPEPVAGDLVDDGDGGDDRDDAGGEARGRERGEDGGDDAGARRGRRRRRRRGRDGQGEAQPRAAEGRDRDAPRAEFAADDRDDAGHRPRSGERGGERPAAPERDPRRGDERAAAPRARAQQAADDEYAAPIGGPDSEDGGEAAHPAQAAGGGPDEEGNSRRRGRRRGRRGGRKGREQTGEPGQEFAGQRDDGFATGADGTADSLQPAHASGRNGHQSAAAAAAAAVAVETFAPEPARGFDHRLTRDGEVAPAFTVPPKPPEPSPRIAEPATPSQPPAAATEEPARPARKGWWNRKFSGE